MSQDYPIPQMGVYSITCRVTGQIYVGQSRRIRGRWKDHIKELKAGRGSSRLQAAWDAHGESAFAFRVLAAVADAELLTECEQHHLDTMHACGPMGLNILPTAGSFKGYTPSKEARAKIGAASKQRMLADPTLQPRMVAASQQCGYSPTPEHARRIGAAHRQLWADGVQQGHPRSDECRRKISVALQGRISPTAGKPRSDETKRKIGAANRGKKRTEEQLARRRGISLSSEHREAISRGMKGRPWSQARREAQDRKVVGDI